MGRIKICLQALWSLRDLLILVLTPIVFSPLLDGNSETSCAYVLFIVAIYWMFEVMPLAITALIPLVLFPALGVLNARDAAAAYMKDPLFFVFGAFTVAVAVENCNLHKRIALLSVLLIGTTKGAVLLALMSVAFFLSMWMVNTATAAMLIPIALAMAEEIKKKESQTDASLTTIARENGGEVLEESELLEVRGIDVTPSKDGVPTKGTHSKPRERSQSDNIEKAFLLGISYCSLLGGTASLVGVFQVVFMKEFLSERYGPEIMDFASWIAVASPCLFFCLFIGWIWLQWLFLDLKLVDVCNFFNCRKRCNRGKKKDDAMRVFLRDELKLLGPVSFAEGSVLVIFTVLILLWFFADPKLFPGWTSLDKNGYVSITVSSISAAILLFILPADPKKAFIAFKTDPTKKFEWERLLDRTVMKTKFPWMILFLLLGSMFALGHACQKSGLSVLIADKLGSLSYLDPSVIVFLISLTVATLCEGLGNASVVIILLPIMSDLAEHMEVNPLFFVIPTVLSASFAFMLPISSGPNIVAYSAGFLKVSDMVKAGCVMNLICVVVVNLTTHTLAVWVFDVYRYPDWAPLGNVTTSPH